MGTDLIIAVAPMTLDEFMRSFGVLCAQLAPQTDPAIGLAYYEALKGEPLPAVQAAATSLARESGRRFLPTTAEWLDAIRRVQKGAVTQAAHQARSEPWRLECERCEDTGWELLQCPDVPCGTARTHYAHSYAVPCACRASNRTYQRRRMVGAAC